MTIPSVEQLQAAHENASKSVQDFIDADNYFLVFEEIRNTHKLHLDEAEKLSRALGAVFLKLVSFEEFPNLLKEVLEQNSDKHDAVLKEINSKIFTVFRENVLKKLGQEKAQTPPTTEVSTTDKPSAQSKEALSFSAPSATQPTPAINKLEEVVKEHSTDIEIGEMSEPQNKKDGDSEYTGGGDPYREPI